MTFINWTNDILSPYTQGNIFSKKRATIIPSGWQSKLLDLDVHILLDFKSVGVVDMSEYHTVILMLLHCAMDIAFNLRIFCIFRES